MSSLELQNLYPEERRIELARQLYPKIKQWETRVVCIAPGELPDPVALSILPAVSLDPGGFGLPDEDRIQQYEALSYTWGAPVYSHPVICNGVEFSVTQNLHAALVHLRYTDRSRWVWIDALCINQNDLREKGRQIKSLYLIFKRAGKTLVWLGEAGCHAAETAELMVELERRTGSQRYDDEARGRFLAVRDDIFSRPWFTRVWVIQEIAASEDCGKIEVHYGKCVMSWDELRMITRSRAFGMKNFSARMRRKEQTEIAYAQDASLNLLHNVAKKSSILWVGQEDAKMHQSQWIVDPFELSEPSPLRCLLQLLERSIKGGFRATLAVDHVYALIDVAINFLPKMPGKGPGCTPDRL